MLLEIASEDGSNRMKLRSGSDLRNRPVEFHRILAFWFPFWMLHVENLSDKRAALYSFHRTVSTNPFQWFVEQQHDPQSEK